MSCAKNRGGRKPDPNSLAARARAKGLSPFTVYGRIRAGWSESEALETKPTPVLGVTAMALERGLCPATVLSRINKQGLTLEQALHRPLRWRNRRNAWAP